MWVGTRDQVKTRALNCDSGRPLRICAINRSRMSLFVAHVGPVQLSNARLKKTRGSTPSTAAYSPKNLARCCIVSAFPTPGPRGMYVTVSPSTVKPRSRTCPPTKIHE